MELAFKPDWEETKQRYLAWWQGELLDRCCVAVTAPKANPPAGDPPVYTGERGKHWFDFEWWAAYQDWAMERPLRMSDKRRGRVAGYSHRCVQASGCHQPAYPSLFRDWPSSGAEPNGK